MKLLNLFAVLLVFWINGPVAVAAQDATAEASTEDQLDKIVFRSGTVLSGEIVEGTKSLIDDPNWYEILLPNGALVSVQDTGQIERVIMDGETLEDPWKQGGRRKLHELLSQHQLEKEARERQEKRERMTVLITWILGDANRFKKDSEEFAPLKQGDRVYPGERIELNPVSRIQATIAGKINLGLEEASALEIEEINTLPQTDKTVFVFDFQLVRGAVWLEVQTAPDRSEEVELRTRGLRFDLAEGLVRLQTVAKVGLNLWHYAGREFPIERISDGEKVTTPPESGFVFTRDLLEGNGEFRPKRVPLGDFNNWLDFRSWKPVEYEIPIEFMLVGRPNIEPRPVQPLMGLPSQKFEFQDLRPVRVSGLAPRFEAYRRGLKKFLGDVGRFPTTEEGLEALKTAPPDLENWKGPYISEDDSLLDPWGQPFKYALIEAGEKKLIDLYSIGENGIDEQGLGDDLR